jgi:regulator of cell morphogenesis and NO signaling
MKTLEGEEVTVDSTLVDIAECVPRALDLFEAAGIDYACRGLTSLRRAAQEAGVDSAALLDSLQSVKAKHPTHRDGSLTRMVAVLRIDHTQLLSSVADSIRTKLLRLSEHNDRVEPLIKTWDVLIQSMRTHAEHEETELFPIVTALANVSAGEAPPSKRLAPRILLEHVEHQDFCDAIRELKEQLFSVTGQRIEELQRFSVSLQRHIHIENNVLYPRALELENAYRHGSRREAQTAVRS